MFVGARRIAKMGIPFRHELDIYVMDESTHKDQNDHNLETTLSSKSIVVCSKPLK